MLGGVLIVRSEFVTPHHFPLRGQEQAEFMAERVLDLKCIYKKT